MAWPPQAVRQLAHDLYAHEPVGQERRAGSRLYPIATGSDHPREARSRGVGQYHREGPSGWDGGVKKNGPQALGRSRGGWTTTIHLVAANARTALTFALSPGQAHDAPEGRKLLQRFGKQPSPIPLLMDRAYEGDETRHLAVELGYVPVVPPKHNRCVPWDYDQMLYQRRNEIERVFRRLKGFRRLFSRFDKLDVMFIAFINFALIVDGLR